MATLVSSGCEEKMTSITVIVVLCLSYGISAVLSNSTDVPTTLPGDDKRDDDVLESVIKTERRRKNGRAMDDQPQLDDSGHVIMLPGFTSRRRQNRLVPIPVMNGFLAREEKPNSSTIAYPPDIYSALLPGAGTANDMHAGGGHPSAGIHVVNPSSSRHYANYDDVILEVPMDMESDKHGRLPSELLDFLKQSITTVGSKPEPAHRIHRYGDSPRDKKPRRSKVVLRGHSSPHSEFANVHRDVPQLPEKDMAIDGPHVWIMEEQQLPAFLESLGIRSNQQPVDKFSSVNEEFNATSPVSQHPDVFVFGAPRGVNPLPEFFYDTGSPQTDVYFHSADGHDDIMNSTEPFKLPNAFDGNFGYPQAPERMYAPYSIHVIGDHESLKVNNTNSNDRNDVPYVEDEFQSFPSLTADPVTIQDEATVGSTSTRTPEDNTSVSDESTVSTTNESESNANTYKGDDRIVKEEVITEDAHVQNESESVEILQPRVITTMAIPDKPVQDKVVTEVNSEQNRAQQDDTYLNFLKESNIGAPAHLRRVVQPYIFGYDQTDDSGTQQHRKEMSDRDGQVSGNYGYRDANGIYREVNYVADENGFRAFVKTNEPGTVNSSSANVVMMAEKPPRAVMLKIQTKQRRNQTNITGQDQNQK